MKSFKNYFCRIAFCVMALVMVCGSAFAAEEDVQYVKEILAANQDIESGQTWMNMTIVSPVGKANVELNCQSILKPQVFCKGESVATYTTILGNGETIKVPFYVKENNGRPVTYWNYKDKWMKFEDVTGEAYSRDFIIAAAMAKLQQDSKLIKDAETVFNNNIQRRVKVLMDGKELGDYVKTIAASTAGKNDKNASEEAKQMVDFIYNSLGDMPIVYTIDVETNRITALEADITPMIRNVAVSAVKKFLPAATPDHKEVIDRLLQSFTIKVDAVYTMHNKVDAAAIAVPKEAEQAEDFISAMVNKESKGAVAKK